MRIDLNADAGESFGAWRIGDDAALLPLVTSVNVACGLHAGDPAVMRDTVRLALAHDVAIGAHPGLPDLGGFGRREMDVTPQEVYDLVVYQVGALRGVARAAGAVLRHVKPHGALYNMAARDAALADAVANAVRDVAPALVLFGLAGSELIRAAERAGVVAAEEVFADRGYRADGSLVPRGTAGALIEDPETAAARVLHMLREGAVETVDGGHVAVRADTVCIHGDGATAPQLARVLRKRLAAEGVAVAPFDRRDA